jgi:hypothetical protein
MTIAVGSRREPGLTGLMATHEGRRAPWYKGEWEG